MEVLEYKDIFEFIKTTTKIVLLVSQTDDLVEGISRFFHHRGDNGHSIVVRPEAYYNELNIIQFICKILVERSANNSHLLIATHSSKVIGELFNIAKLSYLKDKIPEDSFNYLIKYYGNSDVLFDCNRFQVIEVDENANLKEIEINVEDNECYIEWLSADSNYSCEYRWALNYAYDSISEWFKELIDDDITRDELLDFINKK